MNPILIIIIVFVLVFFVWATLQSNGFSIFKGGKKQKKSPEISEKQVLPEPEKEKKPKTLKIKKQAIKDDMAKSELKKTSEDSSKGAGGGVVERVYIEPQTPTEEYKAINSENKKSFSEDDFEKELDQLIKDLENERKTQGRLPNKIATGDTLFANPTRPKKNEFDWDEFEKSLNQSETSHRKTISFPDLEQDTKGEFDFFADSIKPQPRENVYVPNINSNLQQRDVNQVATTIYRSNQVVEQKKENQISNEPLLDKSSFSERFSKGFVTGKEKGASNQVVVRDDKNLENTVAKEKRKRWL